MDFQNVPSYNEVNSWNPDALSDYFRAHSLRDCEKSVKKYGITGKRFLEMSENDMQKFPKLSVPMLIKVQQAINKKEDKRPFFAKRTPTQKGHQETEYPSTDNNEDFFDSSFDDEDDYESPNDDDVDYECPENDDDEIGSDDYEPPPSNNEDALPGIFPSKPNLGNSDYIDRNPAGSFTKGPPQPPMRPEIPLLPAARGPPHTGFPPPSFQEDRLPKPVQSSGPAVDRNTKPTIQISGPPKLGKGFPVTGKKPTVPMKVNTLPNRPAQDKVPDLLKKPPVPKEDFGRKTPSPRPVTDNRRHNVEEDGRQRHIPFSSNTFPLINQKPSSKNVFTGSHTLPVTDNISAGVPSPSSHKGNMSRSFSEGVCNGRPPAPIPSNSAPQPPPPTENEKPWYTGSISRSEAETALRSIDQDGTFLVRDSSKATSAHPYVLMVLYKDKVYNIQMRYDLQKHMYYLGSGRRGQESFTSVTEIIEFFQRTPLLLIDGKDPGSRHHCMLTYSAGNNIH
ncbi:lymphocyte cytosolic protein 2 [Discoglossus pictus]